MPTNVTNMTADASKKFTLPHTFWLVMPSAHESGGVTRTRDVIEDKKEGVKGRKTEARTVQVVADEVERERAQKIANKARALVAKHLQYTPLGYMCSPETLATFDAAMAPIKVEAETHNNQSFHTFVHLKMLRVECFGKDIGGEEIAEVAEKLRTELSAMRDAVRAGDLDAFRHVKARSPNLVGLCMGAIKLSVEMGVKEAQDAIDAIRTNDREIERAKSKGENPPARIDPATLNLGNLETAIDMLQG